MINGKYFFVPVILGIIPSAIVGMLLLLAWLFPTDLLSLPVMLSLYLFMLYSIPAAYAGYLVNLKILSSPTGSMISVPNDVKSWLFVVVFYILVGVIINLIAGIRPVKPEGKSPIGA